MDKELHKLTRRIQVHNRYVISAGLRLLQLSEQHGNVFKKTDAVCRNIIRFYKDKGTISNVQLTMLKDRIPAYAELLLSTGGVDPKLMQEYAGNAASATTVQQEGGKKASLLVSRGYHIQLTFPKNLLKVKSAIEKMGNPRYVPKQQIWKVRADVHTIETLEHLGFVFDDKLNNWNRRHNPKFFKQPVVDDAIFKGLKKTLRPFQKEGIAYVLSRHNSALIADEMGLGKTVQAIGWAHVLKAERPFLIVCPASLKYNWAEEIQAWIPNPTIYVLESKPQANKPYTQMFAQKYLFHKGAAKNVFVIINYNILPDSTEKVLNKKTKKKEAIPIPNTGWWTFLKRAGFRCLTFDEVQYLKNKKAARTQASLKVAKSIPNKIALSGTPITSRPVEFFNVLNMLSPYVFNNFMEFTKRFCDAKHNGFGWDFSGASNGKELHEMVSAAVMIRRLKSVVLPELPKKVRSVIPISISNASEYRKAHADVIGWMREKGMEEAATNAERAQALTRIQALQKLAVQGKIDQCIQWISDFIESGEKLVVFATHKHIVTKLINKFGHYSASNKGIAVEVVGDTPAKRRQEHVNIFQNDERCRLFVGNIEAAGVGLTLTRASNTCFLELDWAPGLHDQAEDRVHRFGQLADSVTAWYLIARGTIEDDISKLLDSKKEVVTSVLDGADVERKELLTDLMPMMLAT